MQDSPIMRLLLACSLALAALPAPALPQASPSQSTAADSKEAADFRKFIAQHPKALAELKKDPSLISKSAFSKDHAVVGQYIAAHPKVKEIVKANPDFFAKLTATTRGGEHGQSKKNGQKNK